MIIVHLSFLTWLVDRTTDDGHKSQSCIKSIKSIGIDYYYGSLLAKSH